MRTLLVLSLMAVTAVAGCSTKPSGDATADHGGARLATVTVDQLDTMLSKNEAEPVDANGLETRRRMGVIPGARLLSDSETFNLSELPANKDKPLVFYCANTSCGASHGAAEKARIAGYTNVKVLPDGIAGWVKAGKKTSSI